MSNRPDGRAVDELRPVTITRGYINHPEGSALIEMGDTKVICTATVEEKVPTFLYGKSQGWVTAEYAMLPAATHTRTRRETSGPKGRTMEIQRLIGRSLRAVVDLSQLGERTIWLDCDVLQADGGTRTAAITGAYIAVADAVSHLIESEKLKSSPIRDSVAAISVGRVDGEARLDLAYAEDSAAEVDMNVITTGDGRFIEVQGTAEGDPYTREQMDELIDLACAGIQTLTGIQNETLAAPLPE